MESTSHLIKSQIDQYLGEIQKLKSDKDTLTRKNQVLLYELHSLQNSMTQTDSQRYINDIKSLESELEEIRSSRDEISYESRNVLSNVKAWLQEQKRINDHAAKRERDYCDTIKRLKQENEYVSVVENSGKAWKINKLIKIVNCANVNDFLSFNQKRKKYLIII